MKLWFLSLIILFGLLTSKVFASSQTECRLEKGVYENSPANVGAFYFFSYADIFSLNNAKSFILQLDGQEIHFQRTEIRSEGATSMNFEAKVNGNYRKIFVLIDRSPKDALTTKMFYGNLILSPEKPTNDFGLGDLSREGSGKTLNYSCKF